MFVRTPVRGKLSGIVALLLSGALVLGPAVAGSDAKAEELRGPRQQMLELTNGDRLRRERGELDLATGLSRYARRHSEAMARRGYLFHSSDEQLRSVLEGYDWSIAGENVGVGGSLESLEDAFMASRLHRRNVLREAFEHAAIGIVRADGRLWVTVIFYG